MDSWREVKAMKKESGFTVLELMVVVGILSILSAIALPSMIRWSSGSKLRDAVNNLRGDMEMAKIRAIRDNTDVTIQFFDDRYTVTTAGGLELRNRQLPAGVNIDLGATTFLDDDADGNLDTGFMGRGIPDPSFPGDVGSVALTGPTGNRQISVNRLGRIAIQ
jgi:prepilin-type N-terminal cleavage/methylation domain-containing protein